MYVRKTELFHSGIKGMRWGIRRYQNEDGTLTEAGKRRYNKDSDKLYIRDRNLRNATMMEIDNQRHANKKLKTEDIDPRRSMWVRRYESLKNAQLYKMIKRYGEKNVKNLESAQDGVERAKKDKMALSQGKRDVKRIIEKYNLNKKYREEPMSKRFNAVQFDIRNEIDRTKDKKRIAELEKEYERVGYAKMYLASIDR